MSERIRGFHKNVCMELACGNDELRSVMNHVYFDNGFAVATNSHILVMNKISELTTLTPEWK